MCRCKGTLLDHSSNGVQRIIYPRTAYSGTKQCQGNFSSDIHNERRPTLFARHTICWCAIHETFHFEACSFLEPLGFTYGSARGLWSQGDPGVMRQFAVLTCILPGPSGSWRLIEDEMELYRWSLPTPDFRANCISSSYRLSYLNGTITCPQVLGLWWRSSYISREHIPT